jgi:hypothetical protein
MWKIHGKFMENYGKLWKINENYGKIMKSPE